MKLNIGLKSSLIIFLVLIAQSTLLYIVELKAIKKNIIEEAARDTRASLSSLQLHLSHLSEKDEYAQIQETVTTLGADPKLKVAYLINDTHHIIASTKVSMIGKDMHITLDDLTKNRLIQQWPNFKIYQKIDSWDSADGKELIAIAPVLLRQGNAGDSRNDRLGILIKIIDLEYLNKQITYHINSRILPIIVVLVVFSLLAMLLFRRLIGNKIQKIHEAANRYTLGSLFERPAFKTNDELTELSEVFYNLTEKVNSQHQTLVQTNCSLSDNEQKFRAIADYTYDWESWLDPSGRLLWVNPAVERLTGYTVDECLAMKNYPLEMVSNELQETTKPVFDYIIKYRNSGNDFAFRVRNKSGAIRDVAMSWQPIYNEANEYLGIRLSIRDITERVIAEQELVKQKDEQQQILDSMVDGVLTIDDSGTILTLNESVVSMFHYSRDELIGENIKKLMPQSYSAHHDGYIKNYIKTKQAKVIGTGREVSGLRKDGSTFPMRLTVAELPRQPHEKYRFIGTCHDITHQRQQEELLRRTQKMDAIGKLTGGIAHDFNNMLGVIYGYSDLLNEEIDAQSNQAQYVGEIIQATERAQKLTSKLLAFSREKPTDAKIVDINHILNEMQHMLSKTLTAQIKLTYEFDERLWPAYIEKSAFEDTVLNISINAMHAMPKGGSFTILTNNTSLDFVSAQQYGLTPGDYIVVSFIDTGCGMSEEVQEKLFEPFFSTKGDKGTGLGMGQVYAFMKQSSGGIYVISRPDKGTRIELFFPKSKHSNDASDASQHTKIKTKTTGHETILVVDDESAMRRLTCDILRNLGYTTIPAESGAEALRILTETPIDLLISDVIMPEMNGFELATEVKQQYPSLKIQLMSGYTHTSQDADPGLSHLYQAILKKPFSIMQLSARVRELIDT